MVTPTVISLFAGCGGSSLGYKMAGYKELLAIDFDKNSVETFALNFPEIPVWKRDIKEVTSDEIIHFCKIKKGELDVLDGSPPCQGFSTAGKRNLNDSRNDLFKEYCRLLNELQSKMFVMENVSGMAKGKMKGMFLEILKALKDCGYNVKCKLMNAMWYDVPQNRERLIFIGARNDLKYEISFPKPKNEFITFSKAVEGLPEQKTPPLSPCFREVVPLMKQGQSVSDFIKNKHFQTQRIFYNKPVPTITKIIGGIGFGSHIHPTQNRVLSVDEMKRCVSFPDDFKFTGKYQDQKARIGNSVPPNLMKAISLHIKQNLSKLTLP